MSVVAALTDLKKYTQKKKSANISNLVFKMHRFTCSFLLCCSALTTSKQFFGSNIHCMLGNSDVPKELFESYCFMKSTYTHSHLYSPNSTLHQKGHASPGVSTGKYGTAGMEKDTTHHNYYQWVCLLLVIQAAICYIPWAWWKSVERGRVGKLVEKINKDPLTETPVAEQVSGLGNFLSNNSKWYDACALRLLVSQAMCLILTIVQLYMMDIILDNQFLTLGTNIWMSWDHLQKAMETVFPIVVQCSMNYIGHSGEVTQVSGMCTLPINIINEKIYLIIWVWYLIMIVITLLHLLCHLMLLVAPYLRQACLQRKAKHSPPNHIKRLVKRCSYGDYILLQILAKNLDSTQFNSLITQLCDANLNYISNTLTSQLETSYSSPDKTYGNRMMNKEV